MSIPPDPPWKKRTRPCPFYSQGRCVFAESCGFLHDAKIKSSVNRELASSCLDAGSSRDSSSSMGTMIVKPLNAVVAYSPSSLSPSSRSPRMASLLSALQNIIGPPSPNSAEFSLPQEDIPSTDASDVSHLPHEATQCTDRDCRGNLELEDVSRADVANATSPAVNDDMPEAPQPDSVTPPCLLSPVQIGSVPPVPFPHTASLGGVSLSRGDSIDSGYAETWIDPTPFSLSPPQSDRRSSTLDLLSSPFGSHLSRVLPRQFPSFPTLQSTSFSLHASIDPASPTLSTIPPQNTPPSHIALDSNSLMYATQARQSPLHACPSGEGVTKDTNSSSEILGEAQDAVSTTSPVESRFFPAPYPDIPVLHHPASYERPVDSQLSPDHIIYEGSPRNQEGDAPSAVEGIADASPFSDQLSLVESYYINDASPSVPSSKDSKITPPHATGTLQSPISFEPTAEVGEFDYEALYQSLVMSPEEAASKRMLWASRPSSSILPSRAGSAGSSSAACSSVLIDIPGSPHSAVSVPPWSHQRDMRTTPPPVSELTSRTSSPFLETPLSSGSSQADASAHASPVSLCASDAVAQSAPTSTPKYSRISAGTTSPHSEPVFAPSREVTSALNDRSKAEPARGKWNRVSTSRVVPFGFRHSLVIDGGHQSAFASRARKRPSALTSLPSVPGIDRYETPGSARSLTSDPSWSMPSWARPLHLSRSSELGSSIHHLDLHKASPSSTANPLPDPSHSQHVSLPSSPLHSSHFAHYSQVHSPVYSEHQVSNSLTHDNLQLHSLPNAESYTYYRLSTSHPPKGAGIDDGTLEDEDQLRTFTRGPVPLPTVTSPSRRKSSVLSLPPTPATVAERSLMFAIAGDDVKSVYHVLEHGHADPNEAVGPQSALAFALTNERLAHKLDIVKALLAHGADPVALRNPELNPPHKEASASDDPTLLSPPSSTTLEVMDPAMRYYVSRADALQTRRVSKLLQQSLFRPLGRVRYEIVGQDHVFEQLFTILKQHSRTHSTSPLIILLCGPSGHGKSFLARRFGPLLGVPTHTVNVTTLRTTHDLWNSYSMSPYEELSTNTLSQFLIENEGKRCVVVLDEIEKVAEPHVLYSLLMPWELGRCSPSAGYHQIDVRQVIWLGTSNVGHDLVFEFCGSLPGSNLSRNKYLELARLLRPKISQSLGASLSSRVTTMLPFVPFTEAELMAIATEAFYSLHGEQDYCVSSEVVERVSREAIECYIPEEGVRSLHRAVSLLMDVPELVKQ